MKKRFELPFIAALAVLFVTVSLGSFAHAQQTSAPDAQQPAQTNQPPDTQAPPPTPSQPSTAQPQSSPTDSSADATGNNKEYVGTIVKQGDKYMFQETGTGTTYDIDHQSEVSKFEGKKVRVHGTMDPDGKTIHVQ